MLNYLEQGPGLTIVKRLQARRNRFSDWLARGLHVMGHPAVTAIMFSAVARHDNNQQIVQDIRWLAIWQLFSIFGLKEILRRPRPHLAYPQSVQNLVWQPGYGIPSGHVTGAIVYSFLIARYSGKDLAVVLAFFYSGLSAWARLYLGVHYPQDIVAGFALGMLLLWLYDNQMSLQQS